MKSEAQTSAKSYSNLAESLIKNLLHFPNKYDMTFVPQHDKKLKLTDNCILTLATEKKVSEILQCIDISKASGIDKSSGRFLKDGANILAKSIAKIWNISIFSGFFPSDYKNC